jgi:hypothetical protein
MGRRRFVRIHVLVGVVSTILLSPWFLEAHAVAALPDPTRPVHFRKPSARPGVPRRTELVLQLTLVSPERQIALINGRTYGLGASINGAVITEIKPYEVTLRRSGRETRLRFFPKLIGQEP